MPYTVFESTNMNSSYRGGERIFDAIADVDIENGTFGYLNGLKTGYTNVYNFVKGTSSGKEVVVADNPAWSEDTSRITNQRRDKYIIPAGTVFRVRVVKFDDEFGITIDGVTSASQANMDVGAYVTIDSSTGKLVAAASPASTPVMEATVMRKRVVGGTLATAAHNYGYSVNMFECKVTTLA